MCDSPTADCRTLAAMRVRLALLVAALACATPPAAAHAADPIMAIADVRSGMSCTALSVVRGTAVSSFDVEVIDVIRGEPETYGALILFRASGPAVDETGIGPGFSGSPIYCPDDEGVERVVGAISYGIGQYGNKVALATPIEEVLGVRAFAPPHARKAAALVSSARPLSAPLTVTGLSGPVRRAAIAGARRAGVTLLAAPGSPFATYAPYELEPGTSVATGISSGDVALAAVGTVTYRKGDRLWAFGHPLEGYGRRSLPLLDAYVYTVVDNPLGLFEASTYKLAVPGRPVGTLTNDGVAGVAGRVGSEPRGIPLTVRARNLGSGRRHTVRTRVADERDLGLGSALDIVSNFSLSDAIVRSLGSAPPRFTTGMCVRVRVRQARRPLGFCQRYFDQWSPFGDLSTAMGLVDGFKFGPLGIRDVTVRAVVRAGVREAFIVGGAAPRRVSPGQRVRVRLRLRRSRGSAFTLSFPYQVPRNARPGLKLLTVRGTGSGGGGGLAQIFELLFGDSAGGRERPPRSVPELALRIARLGGPQGIRATIARKGEGRIVHRTKRVQVRGRTQIPLLVR